ncbi:hypothetical protein BJ742DRAFT_818567 [Cladochytrium replicatum]|nr:hypothetical protein BJ742DRAFT_818567 [Cladochytrium replicatum]
MSVLFSRARDLRALLLEVCREIDPQPTAILLSAGLDTSILADVAFSLTTACTTIASPSATDLPFSKSVASANNLNHHIVSLPTPASLVFADAAETPQPSELLIHVIKTLETFDPMELRGGLSVAAALKRLSEVLEPGAGVLAGDGADELFAGYSFMHGKSERQLRTYIDRMIGHMSFSAGPLAESFGLHIVQPYLHPRIIEFAKTCTKDELVATVGKIRLEKWSESAVAVAEGVENRGALDPATAGDDDATLGKLLLRLAFPDARSAWRRKDPAEQGSGSVGLSQILESRLGALEFETSRKDAWEKEGVTLRDAEQAFYYSVFRACFPPVEKDGKVVFEGCGRERWGADPCRACGFEIGRAEQWFCVVCGEWPARNGTMPVDEA